MTKSVFDLQLLCALRNGSTATKRAINAGKVLECHNNVRDISGKVT